MGTGRRQPFGTLPDGRAVEALAISGGGLSARILTLGAILNDLRLDGVAHGLTLGADHAAPYADTLRYHGAIVGPVANRIAGARTRIAGKEYRFPANEAGRTLLHGGTAGTHAQIWQVVEHGEDAVTMALDLADGAGGFPGNRQVRARYAIAGPGTLDMVIEARSDAPTLFNFAHHGYWNLDGTPTFAGHRLRIAAERYLPVDAELIPTGAPAAVAGTAFDFRAGRVLDPERDPRIDHNFCLADAPRALSFAAELVGTSGVTLTLSTTEPGLQVYDAAKAPERPPLGHEGLPMGRFSGLALEAQGWPDAPNHPRFPKIAYGPGETFRQHSRFAFGRATA